EGPGPAGSLIAKRNSHHPRGLLQVVVERNELGAADDFAERYRYNFGRVVGHHLSELASQHQFDRFSPESRRQRAIECVRLAAALQMAEHDMPRFLSRQASQLVDRSE